MGLSHNMEIPPHAVEFYSLLTSISEINCTNPNNNAFEFFWSKICNVEEIIAYEMRSHLNPKVMKKNYWPILMLLTICITSCHKDKVPATIVSPAARTYSSAQLQNYFALMCTITKGTKGFYPTQAARAYGYLGIAAYESVYSGIEGAESLSGQINGLKGLPRPQTNLVYNWAISSNAAVAEMIRDMFGSSLSQAYANMIDSTETSNLAALSPNVDQSVISRSIQYGKSVTDAIYQFSTSDGADKSYLNPFNLPYTVPTCDACWVPTNPSIPNPISPNWGSNRPFLTANISSVVPNAPTTFAAQNSSHFYANAMEVYNQVRNNTADQVEIAKYWADDPFNTCTPSGHTFNVLVQLLKENKATLEKASVAFAKLSIAENDAFISCWKCKYQYNMIRPVSYIKKYIDPTFTTVIGTPAFPSYSSGHAYESGAASKIFTNLFADGSGNYNFTDYSQVQYGFQPRQYRNFNDMALECANSRFYGGIHYNQDNMEGLRMGQEVGDNVNSMIVWPTNLK